MNWDIPILMLKNNKELKKGRIYRVAYLRATRLIAGGLATRVTN